MRGCVRCVASGEREPASGTCASWRSEGLAALILELIGLHRRGTEGVLVVAVAAGVEQAAGSERL